MSPACRHLHTVTLISVQSRGLDRGFFFFSFFFFPSSWTRSVCAKHSSSRLNEVFAGCWTRRGEDTTALLLLLLLRAPHTYSQDAPVFFPRISASPRFSTSPPLRRGRKEKKTLRGLEKKAKSPPWWYLDSGAALRRLAALCADDKELGREKEMVKMAAVCGVIELMWRH